MRPRSVLPSRRPLAGLAIAALATLSACSDGTGPAARPISPAESQAVQSLLMQSPRLSSFGSFAPAVMSLAGGVGTLAMTPALSSTIAAEVLASGAGPQRALAGEYRVVGVLLNITLTGPAGSTPLSVFGLVGWNGIDLVAKTAENLVFVGAVGASVIPGNGSGFTTTIASGAGIGSVVRRNPAMSWDGTSGTFSVTSWSAGFTHSCALSLVGIGGGACAVSTGLMSGSFGFVAAPLGGTGTVTFPMTSFTGVPLVVMTVALTQ